MGCKEPNKDMWYLLCIDGKYERDGTTPSQCQYYR